MKKDIRCEDSKAPLFEGLRKLADPVKATLGPNGQLVAYKDAQGNHKVTKDGVTVAANISLVDPFEDMGAQLVKGVALKTVQEAGDGTTSSIVLAQAIVQAGIEILNKDKNPIHLKNEIEEAVKEVVACLKEMAIPISGKESLKQVALVSSNNDEEVAEMVASALDAVGLDGATWVEDSAIRGSKLEVVSGARFYGGFLHPIFINNGLNNTIDYENPRILIADTTLNNPQMLKPLLEDCAKTKRPLIIICNEIEERTTLATLAVNKRDHGLPVAAAQLFITVKQFRKPILSDIALFTGATVYTPDLGKELENTGLTLLGECDRIVISDQQTTIFGGKGDKVKIQERVNYLKSQLIDAKSPDEKSIFRSRIATLTGGIATIYIGGATEAELKERKDRVDDALKATRCAMEEGVVPGGGTAYIRAINSITANTEGAQLVRDAMYAPLAVILANGGEEEVAKIVGLVETMGGNNGYNARTRCHVDMVKDGIVDPAKVCRLAIESAASIAGLVLTTGAIIVDHEA